MATGMAHSNVFTNDEGKNRILNVYAKFVSDVEPDRLFDWLVQEHVITIDQKQRMRRENHIASDRCRAILDHLFSIQHPRAFLVVREALSKENHYLLEEIDNQEPGSGIRVQPEKLPDSDALIQELEKDLTNTELRRNEGYLIQRVHQLDSDLRSDVFTNDEVKNRILNVYAKFVSDVEPDRLFDWLVQEHVITIDQKQRMRRENHIASDRCRAILDHLFSIQHPRAFLVVREALSKENHYLLEEIDNQEPGSGIRVQPEKLPDSDAKNKIRRLEKDTNDQKRAWEVEQALLLKKEKELETKLHLGRFEDEGSAAFNPWRQLGSDAVVYESDLPEERERIQAPDQQPISYRIEKASRSLAQFQCVVCREQWRTTATTQCRHVVCCSTCIQQTNQNCVVCRGEVKKRLKVEFHSAKLLDGLDIPFLLQVAIEEDKLQVFLGIGFPENNIRRANHLIQIQSISEAQPDINAVLEFMLSNPYPVPSMEEMDLLLNDPNVDDQVKRRLCDYLEAICKCAICRRNFPDICLLPCRHLALCRSCFLRQPRPMRCPDCEMPIKNQMVVYMA